MGGPRAGRGELRLGLCVFFVVFKDLLSPNWSLVRSVATIARRMLVGTSGHAIIPPKICLWRLVQFVIVRIALRDGPKGGFAWGH